MPHFHTFLQIKTAVSRLLAFFGLIISMAAQAAPQDSIQLRAGATTSNITPELGLDIIGGFAQFHRLMSMTNCSRDVWSLMTGRRSSLWWCATSSV